MMQSVTFGSSPSSNNKAFARLVHYRNLETLRNLATDSTAASVVDRERALRGVERDTYLPRSTTASKKNSSPSTSPKPSSPRKKETD